MKALLFLVASLIPSIAFGQEKLEPYRLAIFVKSVEQSSQWYERNLDFSIYKKMDFPQYDSLKIYFLRHNGFELELIEKRTSFSIRKFEPNYNSDKAPLRGFTKIAFRVDAINRVFEKMKQNGVKVIMGITNDKEFDEDFFMVEDLDENTVQVIKPHKK